MFATANASNKFASPKFASPQLATQKYLDKTMREANQVHTDQVADNAIIAAMPVAVVVLDNHGRVESANKAAISLLEHALIGALWRDVLADILAPEAASGHEVLLNNQRIVKVDMSPIPDRKGQLIVFTDLTETRRLHQRVAQLQRLSALGEMVAKLAHQIRTPLSAAMLYSDNLKGMMRDPLAAQFGDKLHDRLKELELQVNDMLAFAKSGVEKTTAPVQVADLIAHIQQHSAGILNKYKVTLHIDLDEQAALREVHINEVAILGAIGNLIHNAAQVSQADADITLRCVYCDNQLALAVADNGPGIPLDQQRQIFTPFYTTKTHGTGLGLAVVKSVINAHQGHITLDSGHDGTCFTCYLPCAQQPSTVEK
jgi:two-component system sensor histidine kinase FlrB